MKIPIHSKHLVFAGLAVLMTGLGLTAHAEERTITVLAVSDQGDLDRDTLEALTEVLRSAFAAPPKGYITDNRHTSAALRSGDCREDSCLFENAGIAGIEMGVHVTVSKTEGGYDIALMLFDAVKEERLAGETISVTGTAGDIAPRLESAAAKLAGALPPADTRAPKGDARRASQNQETDKPEPGKGILVVTTDPSGAAVSIGGPLRARNIGKSPLKRTLQQNLYRVAVSKDGYTREKFDVTVLAGETLEVHLDLYKSKKLIYLGHGLFWPGFFMGIGSALLFINDYNTSGLALAAVGGALVTAGLTLLITGRVRLSREKQQRNNLSIVPAETLRGLALSYRHVF